MRDTFAEPALRWRDAARDELAARRFDLLVVGGGIIGAGIAFEAAGRGLAVALVDAADFGSQTSSASSKLVHGGLRYLRLGHVGLVREAHAERRTLVETVAPHLVRRIPFLVPLRRDGPYRPATIRAGLFVYSTLARDRLAGNVPPARARRMLPALRGDGLRGCGRYADAVTHDGRLCLANVRGAADRGATVLNHADAVAIRIERGRAAGAEVVDRLDGAAVAVRARVVVNATGPWVDRVRRLEDPAAAPVVRLSKGTHALLAVDGRWPAAVAIPQDRVRVSFAVPWEGMLLVGTTDTLHPGEPAAVEPTDGEVRELLAEAAVALDPAVVRPDAVRSAFAGLRVLPRGGPDTAAARRETMLLRGPAGMLSVAGGKLTTYRRIALAALDRLSPELGAAPRPRPPAALPGAAPPAAVRATLEREWPALPPAVHAHLAHLYGTLAAEVLAPARDDPALLEPFAAGPGIAAQALYAVRREWACTLEDVVARRMTLAYRGEASPAACARVGALVA
jgi:glycerol-3-phosphate dehydrogenase